MCVLVAAANNIYKEAAAPLATAIVANYILVSLDTHASSICAYKHTQWLPLQPTKKSLARTLTRNSQQCVCQSPPHFNAKNKAEK